MDPQLLATKIEVFHALAQFFQWGFIAVAVITVATFVYVAVLRRDN